MLESREPWEFGEEDPCKPQKICLICGNEDEEGGLYKYLDLGDQPLANEYPSGAGWAKKSERYPLGLNFCPVCKHSQLTHLIDPRLMFEIYPYVSGTSSTLRNYFKNFAYGVNAIVGPNLGRRKRVLDIASNDGSLLKEFKNLGWETLGIDPAKNCARMAQEQGIETRVDYFNSELASRMFKREGVELFDVITAQNVVGHVQSPIDFLCGCKTLLKEKGILYIQTSQADMILNGEFDTVYFEHVSYFNLRSMSCLASRCGFNLYDVQIAPIHGGSYVFVLKPVLYRRGKNPHIDTPKRSVVERHKSEVLEERYNIDLYRNFQPLVSEKIAKGMALINDLRSKNEFQRFCGFGAAAKGNTYLNYSGLELDYIVDENPLKQNKFTPSTAIPIRHPDILYREKERMVIVILAWNFKDEIIRNVKEKRRGKKDIFVTLLPDPMIETVE